MKRLLTYHGMSCFIVIVLSIALYLIWRSNSPYPHTLNWDIWEHQTVVNAIRNGSLALFPSMLSDTFRFDGYTTIFHLFIAGIQTLTHVKNILGFWWIAEGVFFILTSLAAYALTISVTRNRMIAVMSALLSACFFESSVAFTTFFLIPQTLAAFIWVLGMTAVTLHRAHRIRIAFLYSLMLIAVHGIVGGVGAILLLFYAFGISWSHNDTKLSTLMWICVGVIAYALPTLVTYFFPLGDINAGEAQYFTQSLTQKLALIQQWYGLLPVIFLSAGVWQITRSHNAAAKMLGMLLFILVGFIAAPFPYVLKFATYIHYLIVVIMAIGIGGLVYDSHTRMRYVLVGLTGLTAMLVFISNTTSWKNPIVYRGIASEVSVDEQQAATAITAMFKQSDVMLISDPATQYIFEALSGINSPGGAYMDRETRQLLLQALSADAEGSFLSAMAQIHDRLVVKQPKTILLVISGRTGKWLNSPTEKQLDISYNIWRPEALSLNDNVILEMWKKRYNLQEVYKNPSIVIFNLHI